jgi:hypothetical protein
VKTLISVTSLRFGEIVVIRRFAAVRLLEEYLFQPMQGCKFSDGRAGRTKSGLYSCKFRGCHPQAPSRNIVPGLRRRCRRPALVEVLSADPRHIW